MTSSGRTGSGEATREAEPPETPGPAEAEAAFREALAGVLTGELAPYADALVLSDPDRPSVPGSELLDGPAFDRVVAPFEALHPGGDRRAVISLWSQWYFATLVIPSVSAILLMDRRLPLALDDLDVLLDEESHRPVGFRLPHPGRRVSEPDPFERFDVLVRRHLEPLVEAVADHAGLAPGLLWSNAGTYFDWIVGELEELEVRADGPGTVAAGRRFLRSRHGPDGRENPLCEPMRPVEGADGGTARRRRVCCLRYLIPGMDDCGERCPLPG